MKLYAIYKDGRRIKRYGVHKTKLKALLGWAFSSPKELGDKVPTSFFDLMAAESALSTGGYSIEVMGETE